MIDCPFCTDGACNKDCEDPQKCQAWVDREITKAFESMLDGTADPEFVILNNEATRKMVEKHLLDALEKAGYGPRIEVVDREYDHKTREIKTTVEIHYDKPERS